MGGKLLVVEDDALLRQQVTAVLKAAGYLVDAAGDGEQADFLVGEYPYDAVILDLGLPRKDGLSLLQRWRRQGRFMPVLVLTVRDSWMDKVAGIEAGADDYLTKPFHPEELVARVRALQRRAHGWAAERFRCGPYRIDLSAKTIDGDPPTAALTAKEWALLEALLRAGGRIVSKDYLMARLYEMGNDPASNTVEVFIARLRKKLPHLPLRTERGLGYVLACERESSPVAP